MFTRSQAPGSRHALRFTATVSAVSLVLSSVLLLATIAPAHAAGPFTFGGANFGAIPDGGSTCPSPGTPRDVTFTVTGVPQRQLADVRVTGLAITHAYVGDVTATLFAPNNTPMILFSRTGATTASALGDSSNLSGPYSFADSGTPTPGGWWAAAAAAADTNATVAAGTYRASTPGGAGGTGAAADITPAFSGVTNPNGTWILRLTDGCGADSGTVTAASLSLTPVAPNCTTQQTAVTDAAGQVTSTGQAEAAATSTKATADQALAKANKVAKKAKKAAQKAKAKLKDAQAAGSAVAISKAEKALEKAKKQAKKAKKVAKQATQVAAAAAQSLAQAHAASTAAQAAKTQADQALATCQAS